eukprot:TRINITY_DN23445_c0_g1_i1.p2 TRINITY_DN23445_c0_g1~~TRINITY_DN23445_c0_g1_i1.p2  ORF type:complete len:104 (-),score=6.01 TRINITY_DN23445_c0_g1_i1:24-335(-)
MSMDAWDDEKHHGQNDDRHHDEVALPNLPVGCDRSEGIDQDRDQGVDAKKDKQAEPQAAGFAGCGAGGSRGHMILQTERYVSFLYMNDAFRYVKEADCARRHR